MDNYWAHKVITHKTHSFDRLHMELRLVPAQDVHFSTRALILWYI